MLLQEDQWAVEKMEREQAMSRYRQACTSALGRKMQESSPAQEIGGWFYVVKQMISDSSDMLGQVTVEQDGPLQ